jgi:hypothetical protein
MEVKGQLYSPTDLPPRKKNLGARSMCLDMPHNRCGFSGEEKIPFDI